MKLYKNRGGPKRRMDAKLIEGKAIDFECGVKQDKDGTFTLYCKITFSGYFVILDAKDIDRIVEESQRRKQDG